MQDRPTAHELLASIGDLLQGELLAATSGPLKHQVRVAGNLCRILERELALQPDNDERARRRLAEVLGPDAGDGSLDDLNRELAARLRSGSDPRLEDLELEQRAWPVLLEIVRGKLAINKPGHDSYDFAPEISSEIDR
ncbi:MAG: DUF6285 domain-containing protein [Myxococcota bacterium]|jgi:hypothetical protein